MNNYSNQKSQLSQGIFDILPVYKRRGETLSVLLQRIRDERSIGTVTPITYAGRLDPMADGLVLLLTGEKCKEKDSYLGLPKTYIFSVLFGVSTDTEDILGKIMSVSFPKTVSENEIESTMVQLKEKTTWEYPKFSSKPVLGKPLFQHARERNEVPEQTYEGKIEKIKILSLEKVSFTDLLEKIIYDIQKVEGDFRQQEIIEGWKNMKDKTQEVFLCAFEADVSSGMYMRGIAKEIGNLLKIPTLAYSITRTRVGEFVLTK